LGFLISLLLHQVYEYWLQSTCPPWRTEADISKMPNSMSASVTAPFTSTSRWCEMVHLLVSTATAKARRATKKMLLPRIPKNRPTQDLQVMIG